MLQNKKFQSNETQEIVTINGDNGVFYNLSNGANIKKDIFFQKYSEMVDTNNFFQQQSAAGLAGLAEQFKNIDSRNAMDGNVEPIVKYIQDSTSEQITAPPEYKNMLLRKFQEEQAHKDLSQYKVYENDDEAVADFEKKQKQLQQQQHPIKSLRQQQIIENSANENIKEHQEPTIDPSRTPIFMDADEESFRFFKSFKRIYPIKLTIEFDERIAEPNFIRMMVNNFEGDIIKFYTKQIMDKVYNDPGFLENKIYEKLRNIVFEEEQKKPKAKPEPTKFRSIPESKEPKKKVVIPRVSKKDKETIQEI